METMNNTSEVEIDLIAELDKVTEEKAVGILNEPIIKTDAEQGNESPIPETSAETQTGDFKDDFAKGADDVIKDAVKPVTDAVKGFDSRKLAPAIIDTVDVIISEGFPLFYQQTLSKEDRQAMKLLARKYRNAKNADKMILTEDDQRIMEIYIDYEDFCEGLPLSEDEKKSLLEPLIEVLKDVNYTTSPGNALIVALILIMIPRCLPLGLNIFSQPNPLNEIKNAA
jgi:hypothetical protein